MSDAGQKAKRPLTGHAAQGPVRIGAPSIRLFLIRLRPRRARLRFTGHRHHITQGNKSCAER